MSRATGKTRLHAQHGNRVFGQLPCFLLFAVKSAVFCNFGYLFYYLVTAVLALLTTFQPVVKDTGNHVLWQPRWLSYFYFVDVTYLFDVTSGR